MEQFDILDRDIPEWMTYRHMPLMRWVKPRVLRFELIRQTLFPTIFPTEFSKISRIAWWADNHPSLLKLSQALFNSTVDELGLVYDNSETGLLLRHAHAMVYRHYRRQHVLFCGTLRDRGIMLEPEDPRPPEVDKNNDASRSTPIDKNFALRPCDIPMDMVKPLLLDPDRDVRLAGLHVLNLNTVVSKL